MSIFSSISTQERVDFTKSLSIMLKSGISIDEALSSLAEQSRSRAFREIILRLRENIIAGTPLSVAFSNEKRAFGPVFVGLVKAGEKSGTLEENLQFLSDWFERSADLKREVGSATLYPKIVFSASMLLGGGLVVFILPKLIPLFSKLDVELPLITKVLLSTSVFIVEYWLVTLGGIVAVITGLILLNHIMYVKRFFHLIYITMPFMGTLLKRYQLALIMQLFSTLLKSGFPITEAVDIVRNAATNIRYQDSLESVLKKITEGNSLSEALGKYPDLYPKVALNIIAVGEKSGTLSESFGHLAEYYTKEVNAQVKRLPTIIEPLLLIFIAGIVGLIALSIILPIYKLTGSITR